MIASTGNARVRAAAALVKKAKARREAHCFVVEGPRMFAELPAGWRREVFVSESFLAQEKRAQKLLEGCAYETVSDGVMEYLSDTRTLQGILAVAKMPDYSLEEVLGPGKDGRPPLLIFLEKLQDPGNLGTILRAGEGAGMTGLVMDAQTADIYNPKVIRSTMGSVFRMPFVCVPDLEPALGEAKRRGIRLLAAHLKGSVSYDCEDCRGPVGFLIGNEAAGLGEKAAGMADARIHIPMAGRVESLNAAVAASVLLFETARQRRTDAGRKA